MGLEMYCNPTTKTHESLYGHVLAKTEVQRGEWTVKTAVHVD